MGLILVLKEKNKKNTKIPFTKTISKPSTDSSTNRRSSFYENLNITSLNL